MACQFCLQEHSTQIPCPTLLRDASAANAGASPADATQPEDLTGRRLGSFRLVRRLGAGGMGTVYLGEHVVIGSRIAVKVLHPHLALHPSLVKRFYSEARAVNLIGHENLLRIFDLSSEGGLHYLIMEYLEGRPLSEIAGAPVDAEVAIPILSQMCDALSAVHARGVVHRDLKPDNVFLVERPGQPAFVKLLDFGIAKLLQDPGTGQTAAGVIVGTPEYMSPEQFNGSLVDGRADLYALGVISYQLATGRLPFRGSGMGELMMSHREVVPPAPGELRPGLPARWSRVTMRALAKKAEERYQSAQELKDDLLRALDERAPRGELPRREAAGPRPTPAARPPAFTADVYDAGGRKLCTAQGLDLFKSGVFLAAESFTPPLFSSLRVSLRAPGGTLDLACEVVHHVAAGQAAAWGMPAGVGVQFVRLTPDQKAALEQLLRGEALTAPERPVTPNPEVEGLLEPLRRRAAEAGADHYALLGAAPDAEGAEIRARGRELRGQVEACRQRPMSAAQNTALDGLAERIARALETLGSSERRAEYDAGRGNFRGVARAISAGLAAGELEQLRKRFLAAHPRAESRARVQATCGRVWEDQEELAKAIDAYEQALRDDPLDLSLHQRYWPLRQRIGATPKRRGAVG